MKTLKSKKLNNFYPRRLPMKLKALTLAAVATISNIAVAAPKYSIDDYLVLEKKNSSIKSYIHANFSYGKLEDHKSKNGNDFALGFYIPANNLKLSTAIYYANLGKQENNRVKGYGLRAGVTKPLNDKHSLGLFLSTGFYKGKQNDGRQLATAIEYEYSLNKSTSFTLNATHYPYAAGKDYKWSGANAGIKLYFN